MNTRPGGADKISLRIRAIAINLLLFCASLCLLVGASELMLRLVFKQTLRLIQDDRSLLYHYDPILGWFPRPNSTNYFTASRTVSVQHNSCGFRDSEIVSNSLPGIMFVGDSFVWGYDVEAAERFTDKLRLKHPEWRIHNVGISGYGTDQEFLLLQLKLKLFRPRLVFLVYNPENDDDDNRTNARYGGYYKPYCMVRGSTLQILGIPVPRGERAYLAEHQLLARSYLVRLAVRGYFSASAPAIVQNPSPTGAILRNMQEFAHSEGSSFALGLVRNTPALEQELAIIQVPLVDLTTDLRFPSAGNHWTPEGHTWVCEKVEQFLLTHTNLLEGAHPLDRHTSARTGPN